MKSTDRDAQSTCDAVRLADMDSCQIINDETLLADQSTAATDQTLHIVSNTSVVRAIRSDGASARVDAKNGNVTDTAAKSRLFDLVTAHSPVAQLQVS